MSFPSRLILIAVPSVLLLTRLPLLSQCCGGSPGLGAAPAAPAPALTSLHVTYTGSTPASLQYGDHLIPLTPNSSRSYDLLPMPGKMQPLAGETVPMSLQNGGGGAYTGSGSAQTGDPNKKKCGPPSAGTGDGDDSAGQGDGKTEPLNSSKTSGAETNPAGGGNMVNPFPPSEQPPAGIPGGPDLSDLLKELEGPPRYQNEPHQISSGDGGAGVGGGTMFREEPTTLVPDPPVQVVPAQLDVVISLGNAAGGKRKAGYIVPAQTTLFDPLKYLSYRIKGAVVGVTVTEYPLSSGPKKASMTVAPEGVNIIEENTVAQSMTFSTWRADQLDYIAEPPVGLPGQHPLKRKIISKLTPTAGIYHSSYLITAQEHGQTVSTRRIESNASPTSNPTEAPGSPSGTQYRLTVDEFPATSTKIEETWSSVLTGAAERTVTSEVVRFITGNVISRGKKQTKYKHFPWGEEVVQEILDPAGANRITTYTYWEGLAVSHPDYGRRKLVTYPDGSWVATYRTAEATIVPTVPGGKDYTGAIDYIEHEFTPWENQAPPSTLPPEPPLPATAHLDALKLTGRYVKTRYRADYRQEREEFVKNATVGRTVPDNDYSTDSSEVSKDYFGSGVSEFMATVTLKNTSGFYSYLPTDIYRLKEGKVNHSTAGDVISRTRFVRNTASASVTAPYYVQESTRSLSHPYDIVDTIRDPDRKPCRVHRSVTDRLTGRTIATAEYVATDLDGWGDPILDWGTGQLDTANNILMDQRLYSWDSQGRPTAITYLDGRSETWTYAPSGTQVTYKGADEVVSVTERNGFDLPSLHALQGQAAVTYSGSFGSRTLAATNWVVTEWSYTGRAGGLMGSKATRTTTAMTGLPGGGGSAVAGGWIRTEEAETDGAARLVRRKNELGRQDYYLYSTPAGQGDKTVRALDAAGTAVMRESTTFRDGRTASITGADTVPSYYGYDAFAWRTKEIVSHDAVFTTAQGVEVTETDALGRTMRITRPRSVNGSGVLLAATNEERTYNNEGLLQRRSLPGANGGVLYDHYSYDWSATVPITRTIVSYRSDDPSPGAGTITDRKVSETFLENSSGLWWDAKRSKIGAAGLEETALEERVAAGPMNLTSGYYRAKTTSTGTTDEVITSRGTAGNWHETKLSRNGTLFSGSISRNGLKMFTQFNGNLVKTITWSPLRDALMEPRADSTAWVVLTRIPGTGQVLTRTGPDVSETLSYYPLAGDAVGTLHRTGRLHKRTPALASKGPEFYDYNARGQITAQWGSGTYPQVNGYDALGRQTTLTTFRSPSGQTTDPDTNPAVWVPVLGTAHAATTTWIYPPFLDLLLAKRYQGTVAPANDIAYTYKPDGQLATRVWKRASGTTYYNYLGNGNLNTTTYSDGTPGVTFTWDAAGRNTGRVDAGGSWTLAYSPDGRLKQETTGATGRNVEWTYNAKGERQFLKTRFSSTVTASDIRYNFGSAPYTISASDDVRLSVSAGYSSAFTLKPGWRQASLNSEQIFGQYNTFNSNGKITNQTISAYGEWVPDPETGYYSPITSVIQNINYAYNALGQLAAKTDVLDSQRWNYEYDFRAQVKKAQKQFTLSPQQIVAGTQNTYAYDQIGNRTEWKEGGTGTLDAGLRTHTYGTGLAGGSANAVNQYTAITQPQSFDVTGTRATGSTVMAVNGVTPTYQQNATSGLYFRADVTHNAALNTRYTPVTVTASSVTTDSWLQYVPPAAEALAYDADGNLTSDGRWFYKWDGENRLIRMDSVAQTTPTVKSMRLIFTYDGLSRRIRKDVYQDSPAHTVTSSHGTLIKKEHYLYEGWNLVLTAADNGVGTPGSNTGGNITKRVASYVWGPDIGSQPFGRSSWQEAGGVGGLLLVIDGENSAITYAGVDYNGPAAGLGTAPADPVDDDYIPLMDHLGNVTGLHQLIAGNITLQGTLDYDAFGREIRSTGPACDKVPFHFSTKFTDPETGLNYYGYRFYDPNNGRWINRDPIEEVGGRNLYGMVGNDSVNRWDVLGLAPSPHISVTQALARGSADEAELALQLLGDTISASAKASFQAAIARLRTKASEIIANECKGIINREFPAKMRDKTLEQIKRLNTAEGKKAWKLLNDNRFKK